MEPERSLPFSQEPASGPYPEPVESSSHPQILFIWDTFCITFPPHDDCDEHNIKIYYILFYLFSKQRPIDILAWWFSKNFWVI
jgi:hypothetical protein